MPAKTTDQPELTVKELAQRLKTDPREAAQVAAHTGPGRRSRRQALRLHLGRRVAWS
jgi:hypothetical protein